VQAAVSGTLQLPVLMYEPKVTTKLPTLYRPLAKLILTAIKLAMAKKMDVFLKPLMWFFFLGAP
jgi:hypothetical protein